MDFGDLLEEWERRRREEPRKAREAAGRRRADSRLPRGHGPTGLPGAGITEGDDSGSRAARALDAWLDRHGVHDKDQAGEPGAEEDSGDGSRRGAEARRLASMRPQAGIDLHGLGVEAAQAALELFLADSARGGFEKVLVITGKGLHSKEGPVLGRAARRVIEASAWAGSFGTAAREDGGSGALWVALRPPGRPHPRGGQGRLGGGDHFSR